MPGSSDPQSAVRAFLAANSFPAGLADTMLTTKAAFGARHWIVDNSGSMALLDGIRPEKHDGKEKMVSCSRYEEVRDLLMFHGELAVAMAAPTSFTFLNHPHKDHKGPQSFTVSDGESLSALIEAAEAHPYGADPICAHVRAVHAMIEREESALRAAGKKACVVIATDGLPTDDGLKEELNLLAKLPVVVVVRLCCDDKNVLKYWNNLEKELDMHLDVLDDIHAEARDVALFNPFLTYAMPLQRLREWGVHDKARRAA